MKARKIILLVCVAVLFSCSENESRKNFFKSKFADESISNPVAYLIETTEANYDPTSDEKKYNVFTFAISDGILKPHIEINGCSGWCNSDYENASFLIVVSLAVVKDNALSVGQYYNIIDWGSVNTQERLSYIYYSKSDERNESFLYEMESLDDQDLSKYILVQSNDSFEKNLELFYKGPLTYKLINSNITEEVEVELNFSGTINQPFN